MPTAVHPADRRFSQCFDDSICTRKSVRGNASQKTERAGMPVSPGTQTTLRTNTTGCQNSAEEITCRAFSTSRSHTICDG
jgi:hypothetical protein